MTDTNTQAESAAADVAPNANPFDRAEPPFAEPVGAPSAAKAKKDHPPLLPRGNPLRKLRGGLTTFVGSLLAFLLMAHNGQLRLGVPLGLVFSAIAVWGVMDFLGTFDDPEERVAGRMKFSALLMPLGRALSMMMMFLGALSLAATGWGPPQIVWGLLVTLTFLGLTWSIYDLGVRLGPLAADETGMPRSIFARHGFWVIAASAALYFPLMGSFSLWDPWETHYGEVAREILARDDWVSLWWAQDGWFWSKPILNFWMQSIAMASLGVHYQPDEMLVGNTISNASMHPEWIVRAPVVLLTILAMYLLYKGVSKSFGRRAGLLGALVLATMPDWFFLAHQTMTDMPFVAAMTAAMGLLLLGLRSDADAPARVYEVSFGKKVFRFSGWHIVFGTILLCAIPQILYLVSRNIELVLHGDGPRGFRVHWDEFRKGSGGGNCGIPGNDVCGLESSAAIPKSLIGKPIEGFGMIMQRLFMAVEPVVQALFWIAMLVWLLYMNWGERRVRRLYYLAAWLFAAIATMGKGPAGIVLPMLCAFAYVATTKRWKELTRLEIVSGLIILFVVALPWYVAMYVRHGSPFTDRLIFHDMFNRAFHHVHDTNEGDDLSFRFYVWQLGYAFFPWTGFAPLGLLFWLRRSDTADKGKGDSSVFLVMWFVFAFALFSFMGTKFHHYIFPAVPPAAMLIGIALDEMLGKEQLTKRRSLPVYLAGIFGGVLLFVLGVARLFEGSAVGAVIAWKDLHLSAEERTSLLAQLGNNFAEKPFLRDSSPTLGAILIAGGLAMIGAFVYLFRRTDAVDVPAAKLDERAVRRDAHESTMFAGAAVAGALVVVLVGRDLMMKPEHAGDQPGAIRLLQLFTYNYKRPWPESLDFVAILTAFGIVAGLLSIAMTVRAVRRHVVVAFLAFAMLWGLWGVDVYMAKTASHWGQHEVIEAYYRNRASKDEQLVAYQMNWKGENFYTGNKIPAFVSTGSTFTTWLRKQRDNGAKVMFFVTEHNRVGGLKGEVGAREYKELTDKTIDNKFVMVRAEF